MEKKVSIITRTRRRGIFLERALSSIVSQTCPPNTTLEWILVNDDARNDELDTYIARAREAGLIASLIHSENEAGVGRAAAANLGVKASSGWAFLLHDDDDALSPTAIADLVERLEAAPGFVGCAGGVEQVSENLRNGAFVETERAEIFKRDLPLSIAETAYKNPLPPIGLLVRRDAFDRAGGFDEGLPVLEDWEFLLRLQLEGEIDCVSRILAFHYRRDADGDAANSGMADHKRWDVIIRNRLIRDDIRAGRHGLSAFAIVHDRLTSERVRSLVARLADWKQKMGW